MSLTYIKDLETDFSNMSTINDYKSFLTHDECLKKVIWERLPYYFGTSTINIKINENSKPDPNPFNPKLTYTLNDIKTSIRREYTEKYNLDWGCIKGEIPSRYLFIPRLFDLQFGFYTDTPIEFDIFVYSKFKHHYVLEANKFTPFYNETGDQVAEVSINVVEDYNSYEIRNIKTNTNPFNLILLGVNLHVSLQKETFYRKKREII